MPLTAASNLLSFRLAAGEAFVVQMKVDEGLKADERAFVMSIFGQDRAIEDKIDGVQVGDIFEFIRPGSWSEGLFDTPGLRVEIAERLKNGRAIIATPTLTIDGSAATVADYPNSVIARTAVMITASFSQRGVVAAAESVLYDLDAGTPTDPTAPGQPLVTFPQEAATIELFDSRTITGKANNAVLDSWLGSVAGINATAAGADRPTFRTNVANGHPAVHVASSKLRIGTPPAIIAPMKTDDFTVVVIYKNSTGSDGDWGCLLADSYNNFFLGALGNEVQFNNSRRKYDTPADTVHCMVITRGADVNRRCWLDGTMYEGAGFGGYADGTADLCIGSDASGNFQSPGCDILQVRFLNKSLTAPEVLQAYLYACNLYGKASPLAGLTRFPVLSGDSQTAGTGASKPENSYPAKWAALRGLKMGGYAAVGKPSAKVAIENGNGNTMMHLDPADVDGFGAVTGLPITLYWFEYYNRGTNGAGAGQILYQQSVEYNAARRAAQPSIRIIMGTSLASADRDGPSRDDYNTRCVAGGTGADVVIPLHTNADIGVDGAVPHNSYGQPSSHSSDGVHQNDAGQAITAGLMNVD